MKRTYPLVAAIGLVALMVGSWVVIRLLNPAPQTSPGAVASDSDTAARRMISLPSSQPSESPAPSAPMAAVSIAARVEPLMKDWRTAILKKDPDVVESLDRAFATYPREFIPALMLSAETDPEERVRSFSTRVLGKLRSPESADLMRKLLSDKSPYVRFNAAWALGELADRSALARLRQVQARDTSPDVRQSARESLRKLEGG